MSESDGLPRGQRPHRLVPSSPSNRLMERCESTGTIAGRMRNALRQRAPFQRLGTHSSSRGESPDGMLDGLFDAFGTVFHVLDFYNNRIADEGFLGSATEERSILSLVKPLGVRPRPPLAASTHLSFTAFAVPGGDGTTLVDAGTAVQSIPEPGFLPQVFETVDSIRIQVAWNEMAPVLSTERVAPHFWSHTTAAIVRGSAATIRVGARVLVTGELNGEAYWSVQVVGRVARLTRRGLTVVSWDHPLIPHAPPQRIERAELRVLGSQVALFGADANAWNNLRLDDQLKYSERVGGMSRKAAGSDDWQSIELPDNAARVLCLFHAKDGALYAGLDEQGLLKSTDDGRSWESVSRGLRRASILCITENAAGHILVGTRSKGVQTSRDGGESWTEVRGTSGVRQAWPIVRRVANRLPPTAVRAIVCFTSKKSGQSVQHILAGTDAGLFCFEQGTGHWRPLHKSLPMVVNDAEQADFSIRSVVVHGPSGEVFIATDHGLWSTARLGTVWDARDPHTAMGPVRSLTLDEGGSLYACLEDGSLYRSDDAGRSWSEMTGQEDSPFNTREIRQVQHLPDPGGRIRWLFIVTDDGLWRSRDRGLTWQLVSEGLHDQTLETMTITSDGALLVCAPGLEALDTEWPGFALEETCFELARDIGDVPRQAPLVLEQTDPDTARLRRTLLRVDLCSSTEVQRFGLRKRVSRLRLHGADDLTTFNRRWAQVRVPGRPVRLSSLQISQPQPIADRSRTLDELLAPEGVFDAMTVDEQSIAQVPRDTLELAETLTGLEDRTIGIRGRPLRVVLRAPCRLTNESTQATEAFEAGTTLTVLAWPTPSADGLGRHWRLRSIHGFEGAALLAADAVKIRPADLEAPAVTLTRKVAFVETLQNGSRLALDRPLDDFLDINTMSVFGNVVAARQGRTVEEVLGSGNASLASQRFEVRQTPVSWFLEDGHITCNMEVRISGQRWHRVDDFQAHGPDAHVYTLSTDHLGKTWVAFGDGWNGARVPSGMENVRAHFKMGAGPSGNSRPGQVRLLRSRLAGIRRATNLVAATGGEPIESAESLRQRAPVAARTLDRVISLQDLEDFLQNLPGVAQVDARMVWGGDRRMLHLSMSTSEANAYHRMLEDSPLASSVRALLSRFGLDTTGISVDSYVPRFFAVGLELLVHPDINPDPITRTVRATLAAHFEFDKRRMGQPVTILEIVSLLMPIEGLLNVRVSSLRHVDPTDGAAPAVATPSSRAPAVLVASMAHWSNDAQQVLSSEMLLLHPGHGIAVQLSGGRR